MHKFPELQEDWIEIYWNGIKTMNDKASEMRLAAAKVDGDAQIEAQGKANDAMQAGLDDAATAVALAQQKNNQIEIQAALDLSKNLGILLDQRAKDKMAGEDASAEYEQKLNAQMLVDDKKMSADIASARGDAFAVEIQALDERRAKYEADGVARDQINQWYFAMYQKYWDAAALRSDDFFKGLKAAYDNDNLNQFHWGQEASETWNAVFGKTGAIEATCQTFFNDLFTGHLKSASDYFTQFADLIIAQIAKVMAQWVAWQAMLAAGSALGLDLGNQQSTSGNMIGAGLGAGANIGISAVTGQPASGGGTAAQSVLTSLGSAGVKYIASNYPALADYLGITPGVPSTASAVGAVPAGIDAADIAMAPMATEGAGVQGVAAGTTLGAEAGGESAATTGILAGVGGIAGAASLGVIGLAGAAVIGGIIGLYMGGTPAPTVRDIFSTNDMGTNGGYLLLDDYVGIGNIPPSVFNEMAADPFFQPDHIYDLWKADHPGQDVDWNRYKTDTDYDYAFESWYMARPEFQAYVKEINSNPAIPPTIDAVGGGAEGGDITETIRGVGKSGKRYIFGEAGPERIVPMNKSPMGNTYVVQVQGNVIGNEDFAEQMFYTFEKLRAWGH